MLQIKWKYENQKLFFRLKFKKINNPHLNTANKESFINYAEINKKTGIQKNKIKILKIKLKILQRVNN